VGLLAGVQTVSTSRFLTPAIDPLAGREGPVLRVAIRFLANTLEQFVLFLAATLALATWLSPPQLNVIAAMAIVFLIGRALFFAGYLKAPPLRAAGMVMTGLPIIVALAFDLWRLAAA
jgi:uncharacterized MAPEG superfamily protein